MKSKEEIYQQLRIKKKALKDCEKFKISLQNTLKVQIDTLEWILE